MKKRIRITLPLVLAALGWLYTIYEAILYLHWRVPSNLPLLGYCAAISVFLTLLAWLVQTGKMRHFTSNLIFFCSLPVQLFALGYVLLLISTEPVVNPAAYEYTLHELNYPRNELIAFFPEEIPEGAQDISFWHNYPFLQGGKRLSLSFTADEEYISSEIERFSAEAKWAGTHAEANGLNNEVSWESYPELGESTYLLPDDYTIYILYSRPYMDSGDHIWNHGEVCSVAISDEKNRILYQMEDW